MPFEIKDRVAVGDNKYIMEQLEDGRVMLTPAPDSVEEEGTPLNKEVLQPLFDDVADLSFYFEEIYPSRDLLSADGKTIEDLYNALQNNKNVMLVAKAAEKFFLTPSYGGGVSNDEYYFVSQEADFTEVWRLNREDKVLNHVETKPNLETVEDYAAQGDFYADGWGYRKWTSGNAECWITVKKTLSVAKAWGSFFASEDYIVDSLPFPFRFVEIPVVTMTPAGELSSIVINSGSAGAVSRSQIGKWQLVRPVAEERELEYIVNISVKGRWK